MPSARAKDKLTADAVGRYHARQPSCQPALRPALVTTGDRLDLDRKAAQGSTAEHPGAKCGHARPAGLASSSDAMSE
jgi:hypothetical protein